VQKAEGSTLDTGQIEHEIENIILPATAENTGQKIPFQNRHGRSSVGLDR